MKALSRAVLSFGKIIPLATLLCCTPAQAAPAASGWQSSGNLTYVSDYLFRGISQTNEGMALQGSLTLAHTDGWYVSSWASNIRFGEGSMELDLLAGRKWALNDDITLDLGLMQYRYPQGHNSSNGFNYWEAYSKLGVGQWTFGLALTDNYFASGVGKFGYLSADWQQALTETVQLQAHAGLNRFAAAGEFSTFLGGDTAASSYLDWSLMLQAQWLTLDWAVGFAGTDVSAQACPALCDDRLLLRLSRNF
jgi:uncharacterized protein (TIGR02001 family)